MSGWVLRSTQLHLSEDYFIVHFSNYKNLSDYGSHHRKSFGLKLIGKLEIDRRGLELDLIWLKKRNIIICLPFLIESSIQTELKYDLPSFIPSFVELYICWLNSLYFIIIRRSKLLTAAVSHFQTELNINLTK